MNQPPDTQENALPCTRISEPLSHGNLREHDHHHLCKAILILFSSESQARDRSVTEQRIPPADAQPPRIPHDPRASPTAAPRPGPSSYPASRSAPPSSLQPTAFLLARQNLAYLPS